MNWQTVVLSVLVVINVVATVVVARNGAYSPAQRVWQFSLIWLVPLIGAVVCSVLARADALHTGPSPLEGDMAPAGVDGSSPDFVQTPCGCGGGGGNAGD